MDPDALADVLSNLVCLAPFCLGIVAFAAVAGLMVWAIRRQSRPQDPAAAATDRQEARAGVDRQAGGLRPWSAGALADLSTDWDARWSRFGRRMRARGTIPSLSEPKGAPLVAFDLELRGTHRPEGQLVARTSTQVFTYRIAPDGVAIEVDGAPWGSILPDGTLLDAGGQGIGSAPRPGGTPAKFRLGAVAHLRDDRARSYHVTLHREVVGHVANPRAQMKNAISLRERAFAPAVSGAETPPAEAGTWLLALAILQVAGFNVLETIWTG